MWKRCLHRTGWTLSMIATLIAAMPVSAQQLLPPASADVNQRLERLEKLNELLLKQNEDLKQELMSIKSQESPTTIGVDKGAVQSIVSEYLQQQAAKEKAEAAKDSFEIGGDLKMNAKWNHGLWFETPDKAFKFHLGGRTQFDLAFVGAPNNVEYGTGGIGTYQDGVNFRRARITAEGTFWEVVDFTSEFDFINTTQALGSLSTTKAGGVVTAVSSANNTFDTPVPTDLWLQLTHIPVLGNFRVGNLKPPVGFEHYTSSRFLNFLERSYQFDAFLEDGNNGFTQGAMVFNTLFDERATWAVAAVKTTRSILGWNNGDGEWGGAARVTWLPIYENNGRCLLHLGLGGFYRSLDDDQVRFRSRTEIRNSPAALHNIVALARLQAESQYLLNPELVMNIGPFTLQAEYSATTVNEVRRIVDSPTQKNVAITPRQYFAQGAYVEALYFLTGEHREYTKKTPGFGRVVPYRNYYFVDGENGRLFQGGAWQVGFRYSWLDLDDNGIYGGVVHDLTGGLNWFLNPNAKIQFNYSYGWRQIANGATSSGPYQGLGVRFAFDF